MPWGLKLRDSAVVKTSTHPNPSFGKMCILMTFTWDKDNPKINAKPQWVDKPLGSNWCPPPKNSAEIIWNIWCRKFYTKIMKFPLYLLFSFFLMNLSLFHNKGVKRFICPNSWRCFFRKIIKKSKKRKKNRFVKTWHCLGALVVSRVARVVKSSTCNANR